jgi:hypothetical protein
MAGRVLCMAAYLCRKRNQLCRQMGVVYGEVTNWSLAMVQHSLWEKRSGEVCQSESVQTARAELSTCCVVGEGCIDMFVFGLCSGEACGCEAAMKFRVAMFKLCVKGVDE